MAAMSVNVICGNFSRLGFLMLTLHFDADRRLAQGQSLNCIVRFASPCFRVFSVP